MQCNSASSNCWRCHRASMTESLRDSQKPCFIYTKREERAMKNQILRRIFPESAPVVLATPCATSSAARPGLLHAFPHGGACHVLGGITVSNRASGGNDSSQCGMR